MVPKLKKNRLGITGLSISLQKFGVYMKHFKMINTTHYLIVE